MTAVLKVKKRNGAIVDFDSKKIATVIEKAFLEVTGDRKVEEAAAIASGVTEMVNARYGGSANFPNVEEIQDLVERAFMTRGYFEVAKSYIIYRYEHAKMREERVEEVAKKIEERGLLITRSDGTKEIFSIDQVKKTLELSLAPESAAVVDMPTLLAQIQREVYDGITTAELERTMNMAVRAMIERDPAYSQLGAQLVLNGIYRDTMQKSDITRISPNFNELYASSFVDNIKRGVAEKLYDERLLTFDLEKVAAAIRPERDSLLKYMGVTTLADRYFVKSVTTKKYFEAPQHFWMRIAIGVALAERDNREAWAIQFYNVISTLHFVPSTPTLFHAGLPNPQLSSCYLNVVEDDLDHIFKVFGDNAQLSKWAGGIGTSWSKLRGTGALIKKAGIHSQGVIPFLKIANDVTVAINRSGRRRGATAVYLETWHYDIEEFLELRKNTGDERRRTHDMNTANWIPDLFMKRVREDGQWTLFSPDEAPLLTETFGKKFEDAYIEYERMADAGEIKLFRRIKAADLWRKMLGMLFETGHPWVTFKDPSNVRSPQDHVGVVHNSNLCTEITLNTSREETAVCNLGWVNFARHVTNGAFDTERVKETVSIGMRMLDNVIDINFYPTKEARFSNMKHRPVGLGVGGFQDALYQLDIEFASERAVQFADTSMELISYYAILASVALAKERGAYESFKGSKWDRGLLPIDTIRLLEEERGEAIEVSRDATLDWGVVRTAIKQFGMRNSNCMAIAPTASTSNIVGAVPSIEPIYKNIYVESNISGDFTVVNPYLVEDLKKIGMWNETILNELKYQDGSIAKIAGIPEHLKNKYKEVFEIDMRWLVRSAAYRGKWIDQSQSLNIFFRGSSGKELSEVYFYAWKMGLKTTYYLRTLAATQVEKSTVATQQFGSTHKRDDVSVGLGSTTTIPIALNESTPVPPAILSQYQMPVASPITPDQASGMMGGVGAAIAPIHEVTAAESRTPAPAAPAWSTTPTAEKPKYKLHRAPEVTCESCQ